MIPPCLEPLGLLGRGVESLHSDVTVEDTRAASPILGLRDTDTGYPVLAPGIGSDLPD